MLATEPLFVYIYCLVDDAIKAGTPPPGRAHRPGPPDRAGLVDRAAAVSEREAGADLICGDAAVIDALLLDKGFNGSAFAAQMATAGIEVIIPPTRAQRRTMPKPVQRLIARFRNRVEASFKEITDQMELARHGAHCFEGLLARTAATLAAHTLLLTVLPDQG